MVIVTIVTHHHFTLSSTMLSIGQDDTNTLKDVILTLLSNSEVIDTLLDQILSLPSISQFIELAHQIEAGEHFWQKVETLDHVSCSNNNHITIIVKDLEFIWRSLTLPIDPFSQDHIIKLTRIVQACQLLALKLVVSSSQNSNHDIIDLYQTTTTTTTPELLPTCNSSSSNSSTKSSSERKQQQQQQKNHAAENCGGNQPSPILLVEIVHASVELYNKIMAIIRQSVKGGPQICHDVHMTTCWMLLEGIQEYLNKMDKGNNENERGANTITISQPLMLLASQAVLLLNKLFDDLSVKLTLGLQVPLVTTATDADDIDMDSVKDEKIDDLVSSTTATTNITWKRIKVILSNVNLCGLLLDLASHSQGASADINASNLKDHSSSTRASAKNICDQLNVTSSIVRSDQDGSDNGGKNRNRSSVTLVPEDVSVIACTESIVDFSDDSSSQDEDSEPILGQLFKEHPTDETNQKLSSDEQNDEQNKNSRLTRSAITINDIAIATGSSINEPHKHLELATNILDFMNQHFLHSEAESLRIYLKSSFDNKHIFMLAEMIKNVDRSSDDSLYYAEYSRALCTFIHNLIAMHILSEDGDSVSCSSLLTHLGVNPRQQETSWPFYIPPKTLSVLAQVMLLDQQRKKDDMRSDFGSSILFIWQNLLDHLSLVIMNPNSIDDTRGILNEKNDINIEHAQLLLFLFHNLKILQRKTVLLMTASCVTKVAQTLDGPMTSLKVMYLARLVHFLEYMLKYLYEVPQFLQDQVEHLLFRDCCPSSVSSRSTGQGNQESRPTPNQDLKSYFYDKELEAHYKVFCSQQPHLQTASLSVSPPSMPNSFISGSAESATAGNSTNTRSKPPSSMRSTPTSEVLKYNFSNHQSSIKFYHLINVEQTSNKDVPRLDGMAMKFVLVGLPGTLSYEEFYDALIKILDVGLLLDNFTHNCALHCAVMYCFSMAWRLILQMPPSPKYISMISSPEPSSNRAVILIDLIWSTRIVNSKWLYFWLKDSVSKMIPETSTAETELILRRLVENAHSFEYNIKLINFHTGLFVKALRDKTIMDESEEIRPINSFNSRLRIHKDHLPKLYDNFIMECLIVKIHYLLKNSLCSRDPASIGTTLAHLCNIKLFDSTEAIEALDKICSSLFAMAEACSDCIRWNLLYQAQTSDSIRLASDTHLEIYNLFLEISSPKASSTLPFQLTDTFSLPELVLKPFKQFEIIECEPVDPLNYDLGSIKNHHFVDTRTTSTLFSPNATNTSLKNMMCSIIKLIDSSVEYSGKRNNDEFINFSISLQTDCSLESMYSLSSQANLENDESLTSKLCIKALHRCHEIIAKHHLDAPEKFLEQSIILMENLLKTSDGQTCLEKFFCDSDNVHLVDLFKPTSNEETVSDYASWILRFFSKLFNQADRNTDTISLVRLCSSLTCISKNSGLISCWLRKLFKITKSPEVDTTQDINMFTLEPQAQENLTAIIEYLVKENSFVDDSVPAVFLQGLIPIADQALTAAISMSPDQAAPNFNFVDLSMLLTSLANSDRGRNHIILLSHAINWLKKCRTFLSEHGILEKLCELANCPESDQNQLILDATCCLLAYLNNVLDMLKFLTSMSCAKGHEEIQDLVNLSQVDNESDWVDDGPSFNVGDDDEESAGEDSDDESLCNKLCTFTMTQREFMNQHWYHCHSCKMIDRVGVCSICARVCHKDHDVTYAKFGAFFCDCGARDDNSCLALTKRSSTIEENYQAIPTSEPINQIDEASNDHDQELQPYKQSGNSSSIGGQSSKDLNDEIKRTTNRHQQIAKHLDPFKSDLLHIFSSSDVCSTVLELLDCLIPAYIRSAYNDSHIGRSVRARSAIEELHSKPKSFISSESLMVPTLGSQEGAFENVRLSFTGEHAHTIRHLMSNNIIRRVAMTSLSSPQGKRQHLVVCHEKGKITLLQLNALLRQADSSKKKLTLTRLASAPVPFLVISVNANPLNEDVLAVCGLKDCHILSFSPAGLVTGHIITNLQLSSSGASNHIIKCMWIPGSQTELAIVTPDFIRIYDLAISSENPQFHLVLPSGKARDITFLVPECSTLRYILVITSSGHIYSQALTPETGNGPFYITSTLEVKHDSIREVNNYINGGGVSIYYSHAFKILFFSYTNGKNYMASIPKANYVQEVFLIAVEFSNGSAGPPSSNQNPVTDHTAEVSETTEPSTSSASTARSNQDSTTASGKTPAVFGVSGQPLCQWSEVTGHVGLILAMCQGSNNPVIFMIKPDSVCTQEIRYLSIKSKITDATAIRHTTSSGEIRTTLILLCEDGSLRIYMASQEATDFWLKISLSYSSLHNISQGSYCNKSKKRKCSKTPSGRLSTSGTNPSFPIDFFEHCQVMNDIEFGGSDILAIYNVQQIKHRLNTAGMHITCTKPMGFSVDIINNDCNTVVCGVRVLVGNQEVTRSPSSIEIFNRSMQLNPATSRWYDFPFTREESIQAEKKFTITFGPSTDPQSICQVDSIKVHGKSKETFSWPEDSEDILKTQPLPPCGPGFFNHGDIYSGARRQVTASNCYHKLLTNSLEVLECCLSLGKGFDADRQKQKNMALELSTSLLTVPYPPQVLKSIKSLLLEYYSNRYTYNQNRDATALNFIIKNVKSIDQGTMDGEVFSRVVSIMRSLAQSRLFNIIRLSELLSTKIGLSTVSVGLEISSDATELSSKQCQNLMIYVSNLFWKLYECRPCNMALASVANYGITNSDDTLQALVEVIYMSTLCNNANVPTATKILIKFLLSEDRNISFITRQTLIRLFRTRSQRSTTSVQPVGVSVAPTSRSNSPIGHDTKAISVSCPTNNQSSVDTNVCQTISDRLSSIAENQLINQSTSNTPNQSSSVLNPSRDHVGVSRQDNDDDMAIAIALSLQDDSQNNSVTDNAATAAPTTSGRSEINLLSDRMPSAEELLSDTTASGVASDDEFSTSAPIIRTPVTTSQTEASQIQDEENMKLEKVSNDTQPSKLIIKSSNTTLKPSEASNEEADKMRQLHISLLEQLIEHLPETREAGGVRSISLLHAILVLTLDLDCENERDKSVLMNLLITLLQELLWNTSNSDTVVVRTPTNEVKLVIMRMLSILMSKVRTSTVASAMSSSSKAETDSCWSTYCSSVTAMSLINTGVLEFSFKVLTSLHAYWQQVSPSMANCQTANSHLAPVSSETFSAINQSLLPKSNTSSIMPDMSPFFLRQHLKGPCTDVFEDYQQLLTEMVLRLPYQIKKVSNSSSNNLKPVNFATDWNSILCDYLMIPIPSYLRKQVRKLLTFICGSKEKYRQLRDFHALRSHSRAIKVIFGYTCEERTDNDDIQSDIESSENNINIHEPLTSVSLTYDAMIDLVEHFKACLEIAQNRCINWQLYCQAKDKNLLLFLIRVSLTIGDDVSPMILELLHQALSPKQLTANTSLNPQSATPLIASTSSTATISDQALRDLTSESLSAHLAQKLITSIPLDLLSQFIQCFLLESNLTSLRWQAHILLFSLWTNFLPNQQQDLVKVLWSLWQKLPMYGRKATQFVDFTGFATLKSPPCEPSFEATLCHETLQVLRQQNQILIYHPNTNIYNSLQGLVDFDSYYLESEPCSVCNSPEVGYANLKLNSIKVDSRFTTTTQIIKLIGSHTISRFSLRIADIKRSKMVKTINIYYNNRTVQSVVELKNKTGIWNKARKYCLSPGQTDVKIDFSLPIIACNMMIEFLEFYENLQASSETLQCPRCSTSVSANPGVCSNCGENVFQCHKCRAINYDEKDPFLCNSCGFCKYAKFDITLTAKPTCAVDPIENEDDRKKAVTTINNLLEKADRVYKNLMLNKPTLELLLLRIQEHGLMDSAQDENVLQSSVQIPISSANVMNIPSTLSQTISSSSSTSIVPPTAASIVAGTATSAPSPSSLSCVNKAIQQVAQKYCIECKCAFEELSKITHKVLASRKELVEYDNRQLRQCLSAGSSVLSSADRRKSKVYSSLSSGSGRCYGCASATVEHCVTMLKALSTLPRLKLHICSSGIINELVDYNLRNGSGQVKYEVRQLLCALTRDDINATTTLTDLLMNKINAINNQAFDISFCVRHEIALLAATLEKEDQCWEQRLKCLIKIFAISLNSRYPSVLECLTLPCLKLILSIIKPESAITRRNRDKTLDSIASVRSDGFRCRIILEDWLQEENSHSFENWRKRATRPANGIATTQLGKQLKPLPSLLRRPSRAQFRANYLAEKYGNRWRLRASRFDREPDPIVFSPHVWLKTLLFNRVSRTVRVMAKSLVEALFSVPSRRKDIIDLLTLYLDEIGPAGECAQEFFSLFQMIIHQDHWRYYLALKGMLLKLGSLMTVEIEHLQELEETTLNSNLSLGYSLKMLVEMLTTFVEVPVIQTHFKSKLVGSVLNGYLSLRKLVVQRTKVIDETQEALLELLEGMTSGNESETAAFISVCVDAIKKCSTSDIRTPVFIFERLCSTIHPEDNDSLEFFINLEKDPQQEDFLQGRMLGNPYSSNEPGMGPLMKDIKNKICQDCELLALLDDDSSMELLVNNKIISLDLPVKDVHKRIWCPDNHETDAMRVIYRMRGLLGDATEEFIEHLDSSNTQEVDIEQVYKMANVMGTCDGIEIMLQRLNQIDDLSPPFRPLLNVLLKLFDYCTKVKNNRVKLLHPELKSISIMLSTLKLTFNQNPSPVSSPEQVAIIEQLLAIMETILREASKCPSNSVFKQFSSENCGTIDDVQFLLNAAQLTCPQIPHLSHKLMQVVPFLTLGDRDKMLALVNPFRSSLDFDKFDVEHSYSDVLNIDLFCIMVDAIERNENGNQLKDLIVRERIVANAMKYLTTHAPPMKSSLLATSEEWKEFTSRPALKYVLRILGGLSQGHTATQILVSTDCIPVVHGLEQVSSDARVGTLAENLLEAIKQHPSVAEKIESVRRQTKDEKKRLAMAVRERQLGALGMKANEHGQVTARSKLLEQCQDLVEETGLICNICREGYKFQPTKVLAIYTYTKRCVLDEFECKPRKTFGYTTVTHFNIVHVDCHMSAVRSARLRDEWESAALQNANTRCNGLLPIWGPQVPESAYAGCLARHNSYTQDSTGHRDIGYQSAVHDIRLQLLRFAQERSFSEDTGGGGPQSNLHLLPYMMHIALYVINTTKSSAREYKKIINYLEMSSVEIIENCYEVSIFSSGYPDFILISIL